MCTATRNSGKALREDTVKFGGGSVIVCSAVSQRYPGLLHMFHGWLNGPGYMYILDDSLVSSAHPYAMETIISSRTTMLPVKELLLSRSGKHSMTSVHCAQNPELKPIENLLANIKRDLSRNLPMNISYFKTASNPWHIECSSYQEVSPTGPVNIGLVGSMTVSILVVAIPVMMLLFVILL